MIPRVFVVLSIILFVVLSVVLASRVQAEDELDVITKKLEELTRARELSVAATKPLEQRVGTLEKQLLGIKIEVSRIEADLIKKKKDIETAEDKLFEKQEELAFRVRKAYIRSYLDIPILTIFSQVEASEITKDLVYRRAQTDKDKEDITILALWIKDLEDRKARLESKNARLAVIKAKVDEESKFLKQEIAGAKAYQATLTSEIGSLSARQKELLAAKTGSFTTSVGETPIPDDPASKFDYDPGFSPAFAAFSFGAPHRVGMSQYGAFGRAKQGQSAETILKAYYNGIEIRSDYPAPENITVQGYGSITFEDNYMKGIAETPSSWGDEGGMEALKAQAIAARSYALAYTNNGAGSICATEACQVYIGHNKGGKWEEAVNQTRGMVAVKDGNPIKAYYSSTTGGFTRSSSDVFGGALSYAQGIIDTSCGNAGCWPDGSYEKIAGSPWFYKAWYRNRSGNTGGRSHPWLNQDEMVDIVNSALLVQRDSSLTSHISQTDASNPDTWDGGKVRSELSARGGTPVTSIASVPDPSYSNGGYTTTIHFETNAGRISFDGGFFKEIYNLRAPGRIWIASSLFNIRKK